MRIREQKQINAILYFAQRSKNKSIERLKLMKLLWLADRLHLIRYGRTVLHDSYNALPHGPIPSKTMDLSEHSVEGIYNVEGYEIIALGTFNEKYFSKSDLEVFNEIWITFGDKNRNWLRKYSHYFPEWQRFEDSLNDETMPNSYAMRMDDFFKKPQEGIEFPFDERTSRESQENYNRHNSIQEILNS